MCVRALRDNEGLPAVSENTSNYYAQSTVFALANAFTNIHVNLTPFRNMEHLFLHRAKLTLDDFQQLGKMQRLEELDFGECSYLDGEESSNEVPAFVIEDVLGQRLPLLKTLTMGGGMLMTEKAVPNLRSFRRAENAQRVLDDELFKTALGLGDVDAEMACTGVDARRIPLFPAMNLFTFAGPAPGCRAFARWWISLPPRDEGRGEVHFTYIGRWRSPEDPVKDVPADWAQKATGWGNRKAWKTI